MSLAEVMAMDPREWDAWQAYHRVRPRFDPWLAVAMVCQVVAAGSAASEKDVPTVDRFYMPSIVARARKKERPPKPREMTAEDFDRAMRI